MRTFKLPDGSLIKVVLNPLRKIPNSRCLCNSGRKVKKCCGSSYVRAEYFEIFQAYADYKRGKIDIFQWNEKADQFNREHNQEDKNVKIDDSSEKL